MTSSEPSLESLTQTLKNSMGPEASSPETAAFVVTATRSLASGSPVSADRVSHSLGFDEETKRTTLDFLGASGQLVYTDAGFLSAVAGLSLNQSRHTFICSGTTLYTWCAIDALFFPEILGESARIRSKCPVTAADILLTIMPQDGILSIEPSSAAVSIMTPGPSDVSVCGPNDGCQSLYGSDGAFCGQVHFFESLEHANSWVSGKENLTALAISDAQKLATEVWVKPLLAQAEKWNSRNVAHTGKSKTGE